MVRPGMEERAKQLDAAAADCLSRFSGCVVGRPNELRVLVDTQWPWTCDERFVRSGDGTLVYIRVG